MNEGILTLWVIYDSPLDYPGRFVLRGQDVLRGSEEPVLHADCVLAEDLETLRDILIRRGLYCIRRHPADERNIVETWV